MNTEALRSVTIFALLVAAIQSNASICEYALGRANISSVRVFTHEILNDEDRVNLRNIIEAPIVKNYVEHGELERSGKLVFWYTALKIEAFRKAYSEARIRTFSPRDQENLRSVLKWHPVVNYDKYDQGTFIANAAKISMWEGFYDTILPYHSLAHEIEHQIQYYQFFGRDWSDSWSENLQAIRFLATRIFGVATTFKMELGAIQAEWEIGRLASPELLDRTRRVTAAAKYTNKNLRMKKHFLRWIDNAHLSRDEYIRQEHRAHRYSIGRVSVYAGLSWGLAAASVYQLFF